MTVEPSGILSILDSFHDDRRACDLSVSEPFQHALSQSNLIAPFVLAEREHGFVYRGDMLDHPAALAIGDRIDAAEAIGAERLAIVVQNDMPVSPLEFFVEPNAPMVARIGVAPFGRKHVITLLHEFLRWQEG